MRTSIAYVVSFFFGFVVALPVSERPANTIANYAHTVNVRALPSVKQYESTLALDHSENQVRDEEAVSLEDLGDEDSETAEYRRAIVDNPAIPASASALPQPDSLKPKRDNCSSRHRREDIVPRQLPSLPSNAAASKPSLPASKLPVPRSDIAASLKQRSQAQQESHEGESDMDVVLRRQAPAPTSMSSMQASAPTSTSSSQAPSSTPSTSAKTEPSTTGSPPTASTKPDVPILGKLAAAKAKREIRNKDFAAGFPPSHTMLSSPSETQGVSSSR